MSRSWRKQLALERTRVTPELTSAIREVIGDENVLVDEPMSRHTTYRIGGPADLMLKLGTPDHLAHVQPLLREAQVPLFVLGAGSNILVRDGGIRGVVLKLGTGFDFLELTHDGDNDQVSIGAATSIGKLIKAAKINGWSALAPVAGTPGTIGGALRMNAGDRRVWISQWVTGVDLVLADGSSKKVNKAALKYGYRSSKIPTGSVVTAGHFLFERGDADEARLAIENHIGHRKETQPLNLPSGGSVFRNPDHFAAGELIERAGLKGVRLQDAQISDLHANFIVNLGQASASDVIALMRMAKQKVAEETGVKLEEELRIVGDEATDDE